MNEDPPVVPRAVAGPPQGTTAEGALAGLRAANERLLVAGLRERELADRLRRQLAFTAAITGSLGEGVYALDREYRFMFVNPAAEELLGWPEAELLGRDAREMFPAPLYQVARSGVAHREDAALFARREGSPLPVAYTAAPIITDGLVTGAVVTFRDITERQRLEALQRRVNEELEARVAARTADLAAANERLREWEARVRLLLEQTPAAIWSLDTALRFTFVAGAALAALRLAPDQLVGLSLPEFLALPGNEAGGAGGDTPDPLRAHRRALAGEPGGFTIVWRGRTFQVYIEPLRDRGGGIVGTIALGQDITELSLRRLHDEFIATVSHQLLTPLAAARAGLGLLELGAGDRLGADERRLLGNIGRNIGRLGIHLNDLLTLNQLKAGTLPFAPEAVDLRAVAVEAMNVVHPLLREKGQELEIDLPEPLPVAGDADELAQAVINLLANAHRHTPAGTRVTIAGRVAGEEVVLTIGDSGPGIPAGEREAIFERFRRLAVPGAAEAGSGLGLAIVRGIVELHGGRAWVESAPGQGAAFHIALPRAGAGEDAGRGAAR